MPRNRDELNTLILVLIPSGLIARQSVKVPPVSMLIFQIGVDGVVKSRDFGHFTQK